MRAEHEQKDEADRKERKDMDAEADRGDVDEQAEAAAGDPVGPAFDGSATNTPDAEEEPNRKKERMRRKEEEGENKKKSKRNKTRQEERENAEKRSAEDENESRERKVVGRYQMDGDSDEMLPDVSSPGAGPSGINNPTSLPNAAKKRTVIGQWDDGEAPDKVQRISSICVGYGAADKKGEVNDKEYDDDMLKMAEEYVEMSLGDASCI